MYRHYVVIRDLVRLCLFTRKNCDKTDNNMLECKFIRAENSRLVEFSFVAESLFELFNNKHIIGVVALLLPI